MKEGETMNKRPNVLFLFADDMRYDTIHCLGNPDVITPNLDELAQRGVSFMNAYIPGGTCGAVCMPSRAMLNTGRTLFHLTEHGADIEPEYALLGETLGKAGYNTFGTGKWHNGYTSYARSFQAGAEVFFGGMYDHWKVPTYDYDETGAYVQVHNDIMNPAYDNTVRPVRSDHVTWGKHSTDLFADAACAYIDGYDDKNPFYMYVSYMAPHDPRSMPQEFFDLYDMDKITLPNNFLPEHPFDYGVMDVRDERLEAYPRTEQAIKRHMRDYYAMISHLDASIGRIISSLKRSGQYDNTIILFSADNGLGIGEHGLMGKQNCYEHSIKMPLIFAGPGIAKNERRDGNIYLLDIFPTLCDMLGIEKPDSVEGKSFKGLIEGNATTIRDQVFFAFQDKVRGIRNARYKLIEYRFKDNAWTQLFDLEKDMWELHNLAAEPELSNILAELRKDLKRVSDEWGDTNTEVGNNFWNDPMRIEPYEFGLV